MATTAARRPPRAVLVFILLPVRRVARTAPKPPSRLRARPTNRLVEHEEPDPGGSRCPPDPDRSGKQKTRFLSAACDVNHRRTGDRSNWREDGEPEPNVTESERVTPACHPSPAWV